MHRAGRERAADNSVRRSAANKSGAIALTFLQCGEHIGDGIAEVRIGTAIEQRDGVRGVLVDDKRARIPFGTKSSAGNGNLPGVRDAEICAGVATLLVAD